MAAAMPPLTVRRGASNYGSGKRKTANVPASINERDTAARLNGYANAKRQRDRRA